MRDQQSQKFLIRVRYRRQTPLSCVLCEILHFSSVKSREAVLRDWRFAYVATNMIYDGVFGYSATIPLTSNTIRIPLEAKPTKPFEIFPVSAASGVIYFFFIRSLTFAYDLFMHMCNLPARNNLN